jgi:predicted TPR repeat methyltransferase
MADYNQKLARKKSGAFEAFHSGDLARAREQLDWVTRKNPQDWESWNLLGAVNGMLGDMVACEYCCRQVIKGQPDAYTTWNNLGNALKNQDRLDEAAGAFGRALTLRPDYIEARNNFGDLLRMQGNLDAAEQTLREVVRMKPDYAAAHNNLGVLLLRKGELEEAYGEFRAALQLAPGQHDALFNLGCASMSLSRNEEAVGHFRNYVASHPQNISAWISLSALLVQLKRFEESIACGSKAVELNPRDADSHFVLGSAFQATGRDDEACDELERSLELEPTHAGARHFLAILRGETPDSAPESYVRKLFDDYAHRFDNALVKNLGYRTPQHVSRLLHARAADTGGDLSVLDLGCGTGLVGPLVRDLCTRLVGVDLSPKMIEMARRKGVYDELIVGDVLEPMKDADGHYDAIVSADVFVYIGNLERVFRSAWKALRSGGVFIFSTELEEAGDGFVLRSSGRFGHTDRYIRMLADQSGFSVPGSEEVDLRKEGNAVIRGAVYMLGKS